MYYLLAESGGTKTEWRVLTTSKTHKTFHTEGINPTILDDAQISQLLVQKIVPEIETFDLQTVWFYGAGLGAQTACTRLHKVLQQHIAARSIVVEHDLVGAARACGEGIVCILGTGSNACWFDGTNIIAQRGGLGYILGDEGSGADMGKRLLKACLTDKLPKELVQAFLDFTQAGHCLDLVQRVQLAEKPNRVLGSFTYFFDKYPEETLLNQIIIDSLEAFFQDTIIHFPNHLKVHFVGSIGEHYAESIRKICAKYHYTPGEFVRNPIERLVPYHLSATLA